MNIKKIITGALLTLALPLALTTTSCSGNGAATANQSADSTQVQKGPKIAYVFIDTIASQYKFYQAARENIQTMRDNALATVNQKGKNFASQVEQFQNKARANQLTQEQFNNEQARLAKVQQDLQELEVRLSTSIQEEVLKADSLFADTLKTFMAGYAKENGYDVILCKSSGIDNVLYVNETYDVTNEVLTALNKRYDISQAALANTEEKK